MSLSAFLSVPPRLCRTLRKLPLLALLSALSAVAQPAADDKLLRLSALFRRVAQFDHEYPRERVFLHLDQSAYYHEETLRFKAYVVRSSTLRPSPVSRVLHVCLLDVNGSLVERGQFRVDSLGHARGEFSLKLPVQPGYYEIKAFTREMLNWGDETAFSRVVAVLPKPKQADRPDESVVLAPPVGEDDLCGGHRRAYPALSRSRSDVQLDFFPEGGRRAAGCPQRVAYKLTDGRGAPLADTLTVYAAGGQVLLRSVPLHDGMGLLSLPAEADGAWAEVGAGRKGRRFPLPEASVGAAALRADFSEADSAFVVGVSAGTGFPAAGLLGLMVTCRDQACYLDTLTLRAGETVEMMLPAEAFRGGVNRIDLISPDGDGLASRLVWRRPEGKRLHLAVRQSQASYAPFSPAAVEMHVSDDEGQPVAMNFSLAVSDEEWLLAEPPRGGIGAELLLGSEVRGYLHRPEYYFEAGDERRARALDLLLMVQGWRASPAELLCGRDTFRVAEPIEERLTLLGDVLHDREKPRPYVGVNLSVRLFTRSGGAMEGKTRTDSAGVFKFEFAEDFEGDWITHIATRNDRGRAQWSRVRLRRNFGLAPRELDGREFRLSPFLLPETPAAVETFAWPDTIPCTLPRQISEVVVRPERKYRGLRGGRYTYRGGERAGMRRAGRYINVEVEADRLRNEGHSIISLYTLLEKLDDGFTAGAAGLEYRGRRIVTSVNNALDRLPDTGGGENGGGEPEPVEKFFDTALAEPMVDEYKSAVLLDNAEDFFRVTGARLSDRIPQTKTEAWDDRRSLILYLRPDYMYFMRQKGVDKRIVAGYKPRIQFYNPDYRRIDLPDPADYRRTLYWNADVETDAQGNASVVFFTGAREETRLRFSAEGLSSDGRMLTLSP
ncbi:MAG: hypothetical protein J1F06_01135 [Prevotellaceae bacterium]|nr:hypothetical protein [Prevotellaceae bacterium]